MEDEMISIKINEFKAIAKVFKNSPEVCLTVRSGCIELSAGNNHCRVECSETETSPLEDGVWITRIPHPRWWYSTAGGTKACILIHEDVIVFYIYLSDESYISQTQKARMEHAPIYS